MKFQTDGLIIKEMNIGEQDKLVHVLTKTHGVIRAFVKGAKSIKNQKCAPSSLLSYSRLTVYKSRESYIIGDARTLHIFSKLRADVCPQEQPASEYLSLILNSLYLISEDKRHENLVKPCLEMRLAAMAGYMPDLRMCSVCGEYTANLMYFLPREGRLECSSCHTLSSDGAIPLSESALHALRHTVYADDDKLFSFSLSDEGLEMLNQASESYLKHRFEKDFKTLIFYKTIS